MLVPEVNSVGRDLRGLHHLDDGCRFCRLMLEIDADGTEIPIIAKRLWAVEEQDQNEGD